MVALWGGSHSSRLEAFCLRVLGGSTAQLELFTYIQNWNWKVFLFVVKANSQQEATEPIQKGSSVWVAIAAVCLQSWIGIGDFLLSSGVWNTPAILPQVVRARLGAAGGAPARTVCLGTSGNHMSGACCLCCCDIFLHHLSFSESSWAQCSNTEGGSVSLRRYILHFRPDNYYQPR